VGVIGIVYYKSLVFLLCMEWIVSYSEDVGGIIVYTWVGDGVKFWKG
jgi:hypothetical protein